MNIVYDKKTGEIVRQGWFDPELNTPDNCLHIEVDSTTPFLTHRIDVKKKVPVLLTDYDPTREAWAMIRQMRTNLLAATDFLVMPDYPISEEDRAKVLAYRTALRNITEQDDPTAIVWPVMPAIGATSA